MKVSIKEIATKSGVSPATVSLALNGSDLVKTETRDRIVKLAKEMGYHPNPYARKLVLQKSGMLGLIVPTIRNVFYADLVEFINARARALGYGLIIAASDNSPDMERKIIDEMQDNRVEGIMLAPVNVYNKDFSYINDISVPLIFTTSKYDGCDQPCVMSDLKQGMISLVEKLTQSGRKAVALVTGNGGVFALMQREEGFTSSFGNTSFEVFRVSRLGYKGGSEAARLILEGKAKFDTVVCVDDMVACGALNTLLEHGKSVPNDFWVCGFDDNIFARTAAVPLTSVRQDIELLAEKTVETMLTSIEKGEACDYIVDCELIVRKSALST